MALRAGNYASTFFAGRDFVMAQPTKTDAGKAEDAEKDTSTDNRGYWGYQEGGAKGGRAKGCGGGGDGGCDCGCGCGCGCGDE